MGRAYCGYAACLLGLLCLLSTAPGVAAAGTPAGGEVAVEPLNPEPEVTRLPITFSSETPGHLFRYGLPVALVAHVANPGAACEVEFNVSFATGQSLVVYRETVPKVLPASATLDVPIAFSGNDRLPCGSYRLDVWATTADGKLLWVGGTMVSVWKGAATTRSQLFGISYAGPLTGARLADDLDRFAQAGVGWLRFPLLGWLPQGDMTPPQVHDYNLFVQEAAKRDFSLLAAFTPRITIDPSINPDQAGKEYCESLLSAAARYGFKVKHWELLRVQPDPNYPSLKGIDYRRVAEGRDALRKSDKALRAIYGVESPYSANALELLHASRPAKDDALGLRYNYGGFPEVNTAPMPPIFALEEIGKFAAGTIKRTPDIWVTEYGLDVSKGKRLPSAGLQAAVLSRALIINRAMQITRTFWRHQPGSEYEVPFTEADGSVQPNLLALRSTLEYLEGATSLTEVTAPINTRAVLIRYAGSGKRGRETGRNDVLAIWTTRDDLTLPIPQAVSIKTNMTRLVVNDLWGNAVPLELLPSSGLGLFPVDDYPRFIDLGGRGPRVELYPPFASFTRPRLLLTPGGKNLAVLGVRNRDPRLMQGPLVCEIFLRRWPNELHDTRSLEVKIDSYGGRNIELLMAVPEGANRPGPLYEVTADIMEGTRRIGFVTLPVFFDPDATDPVQ